MPTDSEILLAEASRSPAHRAAIDARLKWLNLARPNQITPPGKWQIWLCMAGRFWGKTRVGAEDMWWHCYTVPGARGAVVAPTTGDLRIYCFEGPAGLKNVIPPAILRGGDIATAYNRSLFEIYFANGSIIQGFSAEEPERLRGPGVTRAWLDELGAWKNKTINEAWSNLNFMLREGVDPRIVATTTPRPKPLIYNLVDRCGKDVIMSTGSSHDNRDNIAASVFERVSIYEGTKTGDQEIHGRLVNLEDAGIVQRSWLKTWAAAKPNGDALPLPKFEYIILSLDTAFSEKNIDKDTGDPDPTGAEVWGVFSLPGDKPRDMFGQRIPPPLYVMLLDCWDEWLGFPELVKRVLGERNTEYGAKDDAIIRPLYGPDYERGSGRKTDLIIIEAKGSGISLLQTLAVNKIKAYAFNPGKADKLARFHMVSHMFKAGLVYVPEGRMVRSDGTFVCGTGRFAKWAEPAIEQWCTFAGEGSIAHDEHVDCASQGLRYLEMAGLLQPTKLPEDEPTEGVIRRSPDEGMNPYAA